MTTPEQQPSVITEILQSQIIGVIVGGLLAFLTTLYLHRQEKKRNKQKLKADLIYHTALFFGTIKDHFKAMNLHALYAFIYSHKIQELTIVALDVDNNNIKQMQLSADRYKEAREKENETINKHYIPLVEIEAKLIMLTSEIKEVYGEKIYNQVLAIINPMIEESNDYDALLIFEYRTLNLGRLLELEMTINEVLINRQTGFQERQNTIVQRFTDII